MEKKILESEKIRIKKPEDRMVGMTINGCVNLKCKDAHQIRELLEKGKGKLSYCISDDLNNFVEMMKK